LHSRPSALQPCGIRWILCQNLRQMGANTKIEWCEHTWNPVIGCMKVGPGCDHCYAERQNKWLKKGANWGPHSKRIEPRGWKDEIQKFRRKAIKLGCKLRVFMGSTMDIFEKAIPLDGVDGRDSLDVRKEAFAIIEQSPELTFLLLTKRPQNIHKTIPAHWFGNLPSNVWFGCTIVNQEEADRDIPWLLESPGTGNKFLSIEPILGPIDLDPIWIDCPSCNGTMQGTIDDGGGHACPNCLEFPQGKVSGISWIITGSESGPKARPANPDWFRSLRDQCKVAGVDFFFKQWGAWIPAGKRYMDGRGVEIEVMEKSKKEHSVPILDGKVHQDYPQSMTAPL
jgi:protein gp37